MEQYITGHEFLKHLLAQGLIQATARRVVIDAAVDSALLMYVEQLGDERLLSVDLGPLKEGVRIMVGDKKA